MENQTTPLVGVIMGSRSDWPTMELAAQILDEFQIPHECRVVSAHRTPVWMKEYAESAAERGVASGLPLERVVRAHLPGMVGFLDSIACDWRPGAIQSVEGNGFVTFHCPDAWRGSGCDDVDWKLRGEKRRVTSSEDLGEPRCRAL